MNSDEILINTLGATNLGTQLGEPNKLLLDKQWKSWKANQTSGVYPGVIEFMLKEVDTHTHSLHDLEAEFVMAFKSTGGTPYTSTTQFALKLAALSAITGFKVIVNGEQKLRENNIQYLNLLRLLEGYSKEWKDTKGQTIGFHPDDQSNMITQSIVDSVTTGTASVKVASPPYSDVLDVTAANRGLMKRLQYIKTRQIAVANDTVYVNVRIPLKYISKFFEYSIQPLRNTKMEIHLEFNYSDNGAFFPVSHVSGVNDCSISIVADYKAATMHYKEITYKGTDALKYSALLDQPYNYQFKMESVRDCRRVFSAYEMTDIEFNVTTSTFRPLRLHVFILPAGSSKSQSVANPLHCLELPTRFQYTIQQEEMLAQPLTAPLDFYNAAIQSRQGIDYMNDVCCNLTYDDYVNLYKHVSIDIFRLKSEDNMTNDGLSINVNLTRASTTSCDVLYILEEIKTANFMQTKGLFDLDTNSRV